jgi:ABC-2 type transport system ATP-binding protein
MKNPIVARGLSKHYGPKSALSGLDWSVPQGSITALVGPNGAGKTTTVKLLLALTRPSSGELRVFGDEPARSAIALRRRIGFVPEDKTGFDGLEVSDLARYSGSFYENWNAKVFADLIADWRIDAGAAMTSLSKGTRTKVFIALALAHDPELLLLDEPTDGLDPASQEDVLRKLIDAGARGRTVVIVTHRLSEVEAVADRIALIDDGRLLLDGDLESLRDTWKIIRARTATPLTDVRRMPNVRSATRAGETTLIVSDRADDVVAALGGENGSVSVADMSLRDLYLSVTAKDAT